MATMTSGPEAVLDVAEPRRGRKPLDASHENDMHEAEAALAEQAAAPVVAELRAQNITVPKAELAQSLRLAETVGSIATFQLNEAINRVGALKALAEIRESKAYKGLTVLDRRSGEMVKVATWEQFCNAQGYSYQKIAEDLRNLAAFGGNLLEMQEALGLGYRDLRLLRKGIAELPQAERAALLAEVDAADGPEEMKEKLAELKLELAKAKADKREMAETLAAKEKVSQAKNERLDALEEQVNRLTSMAPDEQQKAQEEINLKARQDVAQACMKLHVAAIELVGDCAAVLRDERATTDTCAYVHTRVSELMNNVADLVLGAGIDVDLRARFELPGGEESSDGEEAE